MSTSLHSRRTRASSGCSGMILLVVLLLVSLPGRGAEPNPPVAGSPVVTNIAQLRKLVAGEWRVRCDLQLDGVICSVSPAKQVLVLADATGAELFTLDFGGQTVAVGQRISLAGRDCEVTRRREGVALGRWPLLENDWLHRATEVSTNVELNAGWHPIRVEWFNGALAADLAVSHAEPDGPRVVVPDSALARAVTNDAVAEPGLNYVCYEGGWVALPDFGLLPVKAAGGTTNFNLQVCSRSDYVGLVFTGWLHAEKSGRHALALRSDDGSRLMLGPPVPAITVIGEGSLPVIRQYFIGQVVGSADAYVWARAHGDVKRVELRNGRMELELRSPREGRLHVEIVDGEGIPQSLLLNNRVSISGVSRRVVVPGGQQIHGLVTTASLNELQLIEAAPEVWAANALKRIADLPEISELETDGVVVRLRGRLERARPDAPMLFRDETGTLELSPTRLPPPAMIGTEIEALAYCRPEAAGWVLEAGFFRVAPREESSKSKPLRLLTTADEVIRLKPAEARLGYPARLRGVITCLWPDYFGSAILQDATRGVFLKLPESAARQGLQVGDFWEAEGTTAPGDFSPILTVRKLTRLAEGRLPEPVRPAWDQLINGSLDAQYVEIEGIITKVNGSVATLLTHWGNIDVTVSGRMPLVLERYENRLVRLRGCLLAAWDEVSGQIHVGELRLTSATVTTEDSTTPDPFTAPAKRLSDLLKFDLQASAFQRIRVAGQIVARRGDEYFLSTPEGGFRSFSKLAGKAAIGDLVDVSGFPQLEGPSPVLREAVVRKTGSAALPRPRRLGPGNMHNADNDALPVICEATLVSERGGPGGIGILEFQAGLRPFVVRTTFKAEALPKIRPGSRVEVTGVFVGQGTGRLTEHKLDTFELMVDSPAAVRVVASPPWWTLRRLLGALGALAVVLAAAMLWAFQLRRRVEAQTLIIREKVEHEATLEERTRIARELHDTLEQALAGVSFQLGAVAGAMRGLPTDALQTLERARLMVRHGQEEARRTVRNLRMFELEVGDLPGALAQLTHDAASGMPVRIDTEVHGPPAPLPGAVENHLLRIGQEAMTNALKHGGAKHIRFDLSYEADAVELKVADDGRGFDFTQQAPAEAGHFGLLGMRERANKIRGVFNITSQPGQGTTVIVRVPRAKQNAQPDDV